jgi:hypothetical protein
MPRGADGRFDVFVATPATVVAELFVDVEVLGEPSADVDVEASFSPESASAAAARRRADCR